jgi:hypothetical protein
MKNQPSVVVKFIKATKLNYSEEQLNFLKNYSNHTKF